MSLGSSSPNGGFEVVVSGGSDAARLARRAIAGHVQSLPDSLQDDVSLLVTELITNAVRHGGARAGRPIRVDLHRDADRVRIEVVDHGNSELQVVPKTFDVDSSGGWGLLLVDRIAQRWGVRPAASGTCVWFELATAPP
jgi:anti-sigma regulatory factor (Ser/Thr protein kinase)